MYVFNFILTLSLCKLDDIKPMEGIEEEEVYSDSSISSGSTSGDEGETPEFVPSAWDKYATPTKSALRSPEKTLERDEKVIRSKHVHKILIIIYITESKRRLV